MPRVSAEARGSSFVSRRAGAVQWAGLFVACLTVPAARASAQDAAPSEEPAAAPAPPEAQAAAEAEPAPGEAEAETAKTPVESGEADEAAQQAEAVPAAPAPVEAQPATAAQTPATSPPAQPSPVATATRTAPEPDIAGHLAGSEATQEATEAETTEEEQAEGPPWNAALVWGQGLSLASFDKSSTLSYNPEYAWSFVAEVGYAFDDRTSITADQALNVELTDSDSTNERQQLLFDDTRLTLSRKLVDLSIDDVQSLFLSGTLGLIFPVSKASKAADIYLGTRASVGVGYRKKDVLQGFGASVGFAYTRRWAGSNTTAAIRGFPCVVTGTAGSRECFHTGGFATSRDLLALSIDAGFDVTDKLAFGATVGLGWNRKHSLADATIGDDQILTGGRTFGEMSTSHWRNSRLFEISASYGFTDWLLASLYLSNGFPEIGPDGKRRGLLHSTDTVTGLILRFQIDRLYANMEGLSVKEDPDRLGPL